MKKLQGKRNNKSSKVSNILPAVGVKKQLQKPKDILRKLKAKIAQKGKKIAMEDVIENIKSLD